MKINHCDQQFLTKYLHTRIKGGPEM